MDFTDDNLQRPVPRAGPYHCSTKVTKEWRGEHIFAALTIARLA